MPAEWTGSGLREERVARKIWICPRRSLRERFKTVFPLRVDRFESNLRGRGTIYHLYNESLTRRQNAGPLIFHVVPPGTRAGNCSRLATHPLEHRPRIDRERVLLILHAGPASCFDAAIHYSPPTRVRYLSTHGMRLRQDTLAPGKRTGTCFTMSVLAPGNRAVSWSQIFSKPGHADVEIVRGIVGASPLGYQWRWW